MSLPYFEKDSKCGVCLVIVDRQELTLGAAEAKVVVNPSFELRKGNAFTRVEADKSALTM